MVPGGDDESSSSFATSPSGAARGRAPRRLETVQREQEFTRTVVDGAPVIFLVVDTEGRIVRFNETCERLFGYADDESVRGRHLGGLRPGGEPRGRADFCRPERGRRPAPGEAEWSRLTDGGSRLGHERRSSTARATCAT